MLITNNISYLIGNIIQRHFWYTYETVQWFWFFRMSTSENSFDSLNPGQLDVSPSNTANIEFYNTTLNNHSSLTNDDSDSLNNLNESRCSNALLPQHYTIEDSSNQCYCYSQQQKQQHYIDAYFPSVNLHETLSASKSNCCAPTYHGEYE